MTRTHVIRIVFQNSDRKSVPVKGTKNADAPGGFAPRLGAPVAMASYNRGSDHTGTTDESHVPPPKKGGRARARGGREAFNKPRN
jgi:hypothetical protein